jgi:hypothetical protein
MSKFKLNLVGGGFLHHIQCSSAMNTNKYVEWVLDNSSNISVHVDEAIFSSVNKSKFNIAWLMESSAIIPHLIEAVKGNVNNVLHTYDMFITHDIRLLGILEKFKYVPTNCLSWIQNRQIYPKSKLISMIGSSKIMCSGHQFRQEIIHKYQNQVDHYGRGFTGRELPWSYIDENGKEESGKLLGLKDYYYSIAMENDNYDIIFVEKITDCFTTGTIPIFWGTKKISEIFNPEGIIFLEDFKPELCTPELYYSKIEAIEENFNIASNLLSPEDYLYLNYLKGNV